MTDLSTFPITRKWPARHPDRLQLYSLPTPNGVKVSIALEETGLPYEPHLVRFDANDQLSPEFLSLNPNNKIPAILDSNGPDGQPLALFESGAILVYLASKTGQLLPADTVKRFEALQWLMFQMGGVGPMFGQLGFFHKFAGKDYEDKRPRDRYVAESRRLLKVLDQHLADRAWLVPQQQQPAGGAVPADQLQVQRQARGRRGGRGGDGHGGYFHARRDRGRCIIRPGQIRSLPGGDACRFQPGSTTAPTRIRCRSPRPTGRRTCPSPAVRAAGRPSTAASS